LSYTRSGLEAPERIGQPVTQIFLDMVCEKGPIVLTVNNFTSKHLYEQEDDVLQVTIARVMFFHG
jgi:hypothetical protein